MIRKVVRTSLRLWSVMGGLGDGLPGWALAPVLDELDLSLHEPPKVAFDEAMEAHIKGWRAVEWVPPEELVERYPEKPTGRRDGMSVGPHLDRVLKSMYRTSSGDGSRE